MTLTDKQYAEAIDAVKRGTYSGIIYIDRWCDGCAVQAELGRRHKDELAWCSAGPHGHWRRGYNVDAGEVMRRLLDENERLRRAVASSMERAVKAEQAFALMRELIGVLSNSFDKGDRRRDELQSIYTSTALPIVAKAKGEEP